LPFLLKVGDYVSTDEIMPAGQKVLPFRSNIDKISEFVYYQVDDTYVDRARDTGDHLIVGGDNYGQGSSREHAAIAPRYLGLRAVIAKGYARIHWQNLANFGVLALELADDADYERLSQGATVVLDGLHEQLPTGEVAATVDGEEITLRHRLSQRQIDMLMAGGLVNVFRRELT
jgi:aconitate hydratase